MVDAPPHSLQHSAALRSQRLPQARESPAVGSSSFLLRRTASCTLPYQSLRGSFLQSLSFVSCRLSQHLDRSDRAYRHPRIGREASMIRSVGSACPEGRLAQSQPPHRLLLPCPVA